MCFVNFASEPKKTKKSHNLVEITDQELVSVMTYEYDSVKKTNCKQCAIPLFYIQFASKYMDFLQQSSHHVEYYNYLKTKANIYIENIYDNNLNSDKCQCGFAHYRVPATNQSGHNFILSQLRKIHCKYNPIESDV
jgi:hypothetical protein